MFLNQAKLLPTLPNGMGVDIGTIVSAACLAHDIGNPPFGHSGERAIQEWARKNVSRNKPGTFHVETPEQEADLHEFEGNAQAVRVVSRIQARRRPGGLQLTYATLGAMMKYPCGSFIDGKPRSERRLDQKKFGFFQDEAGFIVPALRELTMKEYSANAFQRHPLAYLVEAADDICNAIVDLEDSVDQKLVPHQEASHVLLQMAKRVSGFRDKGYQKDSRVRWLRAYAMNALIDACMNVFKNNLADALHGKFPTSLIEASDAVEEYQKAKDLIAENAYTDRRVLEVEAAGFKVIGGLLDVFVPALVADSPNKADEKLRLLFPLTYLQQLGDKVERPLKEALNKLSIYQRILAATDYVSGMTDTFAVDLFQKLSGIRLPN